MKNHLKKPEVLHEKMKIVLPMGILKKKISTPNLTSHFETHKNVGDNFYFVYKYIYIYKF